VPPAGRCGCTGRTFAFRWIEAPDANHLKLSVLGRAGHRTFGGDFITQQVFRLLKMQIAKAKARGLPVAVGGPFASSTPDAPELRLADFKILDEGEITLPQFIEAISRGEKGGDFPVQRGQIRLRLLGIGGIDGGVFRVLGGQFGGDQAQPMAGIGRIQPSMRIQPGMGMARMVIVAVVVVAMIVVTMVMPRLGLLLGPMVMPLMPTLVVGMVPMPLLGPMVMRPLGPEILPKRAFRRQKPQLLGG
jgi:hypothetical protein